MRYIFATIVLIMSFLGIILNLMMASVAIQPDWSLAVLLAAMLSHRGNWLWVLPGIMIHDVALYWTVLGAFPTALLLPILLIYSDQQLGAALPQRILLMLLGCLPMLLWLGAQFSQWLLTLLLCISLWYMMADWHERSI